MLRSYFPAWSMQPWNVSNWNGFLILGFHGERSNTRGLVFSHISRAMGTWLFQSFLSSLPCVKYMLVISGLRKITHEMGPILWFNNQYVWYYYTILYYILDLFLVVEMSRKTNKDAELRACCECFARNAMHESQGISLWPQFGSPDNNRKHTV